VQPAPEALSRVRDAPEDVDVVVVSRTLPEPLAYAQRVRAATDDAAIVLLAEGDARAALEQSLRFSPFLSGDVVCVADVPELVEREIAAAAERVRRRRRHRDVLAQASRQLGAAVPPPPRAERYLGALLEVAPVGVVAVDAAGAVVSWNRHVAELLGLSERDVLGRGIAEVLPAWPDVAAEVAGGADRAQRLVPVGGRTLSLTLAPLRGGGGMLGVVEDVTEREHLLRRVEEHAQAARVLEAFGDGVAVVGRGGVVELWNPAAAVITGVERERVVGRRAADVVPGWEELASAVEPAEPQRRPRPRIHPLVTRRGEVWLSVAAIRDRDATVYAFRDVTDERRLEQTRSEFVATVSHELRTPLAAVYGAAQTLLRPGLSPEAQTSLVRAVAEQADRLRAIVEDILVVRQLDSGHLRVQTGDVDLVAVATAAAAEVDTAHGAGGIRVIADGEVRAHADEARLRQVLANLLDNALKYGGEETPEVRVEQAGRVARVAVLDRGPGIPVGERERVFERFYRLDPQMSGGVGGTGLGLYISREVVRRMSGRLTVADRPDGGAAFVVELPTAP
ncbi:MAG TPA: ATP-binding protein, partial [Gaiellaceae bacterium]|nr:ATP-binding protein [Gaiellaceae bacterium]